MYQFFYITGTNFGEFSLKPGNLKQFFDTNDGEQL